MDEWGSRVLNFFVFREGKNNVMFIWHIWPFCQRLDITIITCAISPCKAWAVSPHPFRAGLLITTLMTSDDENALVLWSHLCSKIGSMPSFECKEIGTWLALPSFGCNFRLVFTAWAAAAAIRLYPNIFWNLHFFIFFINFTLFLVSQSMKLFRIWLFHWRNRLNINIFRLIFA